MLIADSETEREEKYSCQQLRKLRQPAKKQIKQIYINNNILA